MNIHSPSRQTVCEALQARRTALVVQGDLEGARQAETDRLTLSQAPGEDLYSMHCAAAERMEAIPERSPDHQTLPLWTGLLGLGVAGCGLGYGFWPLTLVGAVGAATSAVLLVRWHRQGSEREGCQRLIQAIERGQSAAGALPQRPVLGRETLLEGLCAREARLVAEGSLETARQIGALQRRFQSLPGQTVDELIADLLHQPLLEPAAREALGQTIQELSEVARLTDGPESTSLETRGDSLIVGGVVVPRRWEGAMPVSQSPHP